MELSNRKAVAGPADWSPQSQCEVCRAARSLVLAGDQYRTAEYAGLPTAELASAVTRATRTWEQVRDNRHTGSEHEPVVPAVGTLEAAHAAALAQDAAYEAAYRAVGL